MRGLRAITDFEYELQLAQTNNALMPDVETMFLATSIHWSYKSEGSPVTPPSRGSGGCGLPGGGGLSCNPPSLGSGRLGLWGRRGLSCDPQSGVGRAQPAGREGCPVTPSLESALGRHTRCFGVTLKSPLL